MNKDGMENLTFTGSKQEKASSNLTDDFEQMYSRTKTTKTKRALVT